MENKLICLECDTTDCIRIKPVNQLRTIKVIDILTWCAREDEKGCSSKRQDGCRFYLINNHTPYETTIPRKRFKEAIDEAISSNSGDIESAYINAKVVYKPICVFPYEIVRTGERKDANSGKRLDGFSIVLHNGDIIETAQNIKKKIDKFLKAYKKRQKREGVLRV